MTISTRGLVGEDYLQAVEHNSRLKNLRMKFKALEIVGQGRVACADCDVDDIDMLTLDHVEDDGAERRRNGEARGTNLYYRLCNGRLDPSGFQILCANHNLKKALIAQRESRLRRRSKEYALSREQVASVSGLTTYRAAKETGVTPQTIRHLRALYGLD